MSEDDRLSQIDTLWSMVYRAHAEDREDQAQAQHQLLARYGSAIQRYLRGAMRDTIAADDAYQEFAVKFLRGDFKTADEQKGRFRSFLKVILGRIVADHYRRMIRRPVSQLDSTVQVADDRDSTSDDERAFQSIWRDQMLTEAWNRLAAEEQTSGKPWMTLLRLRVENPDCRSQELASLLAEHAGEPFNVSRLRVLLHRSREKFANYLIDAIADTLRTHSVEEIEAELAELELLQYCQGVLEKRKRDAAPED